MANENVFEVDISMNYLCERERKRLRKKEKEKEKKKNLHFENDNKQLHDKVERTERSPHFLTIHSLEYSEGESTPQCTPFQYMRFVRKRKRIRERQCEGVGVCEGRQFHFGRTFRSFEE